MATKAQMVRDLLAANKGKSIDDLVDVAVKKTGLSKTLARVYLKNNQGKTSKKKTSSKKTVAKKVVAKK